LLLQLIYSRGGELETKDKYLREALQRKG